MGTILPALLFLGGFGAAVGLSFVLAARLFNVDADPRLERILTALPGADCGACGFHRCREFARAVLDGEASPTACTLAGQATTTGNEGPGKEDGAEKAFLEGDGI